MPETIDGVVYPTTPVIPASPNTAAGGNRPYPTSASPGKALWQLLQRYAQQLDAFETGPIRTLSDVVAALSAAVAAASVVPIRRSLTKTTQQDATFYNTTSNAYVPLTWVADNDDQTSPTITVDASGGIKVPTAGLYEISAKYWVSASGASSQTAIRKNGTEYVANRANSSMQSIHAVMALAANDVIDVCYVIQNTAGTITVGYPRVAGVSGSTAPSGAYANPRLSIVRLGGV